MNIFFGEVKFNIKIASSFMEKFMGLQGVKYLPAGTGLWIKNCSSIHCFNMLIPIDVIYLDEDDTVLYVETVKPWHVGKLVKGAKSVVEVNACEAREVKVGTKMTKAVCAL